MYNPAVHPVDFVIGNSLASLGLEVNGYSLSFIIWNILLAVIAVLFSRYAAKILESKKAWYIKSVVSVVWLALLPNTAYLISDARHIVNSCQLYSYGHICDDISWHVFFFFAYAAIGWPAYVLALRPMKNALYKRFGSRLGAIATIVIIYLSALGVMVGLVDRFNVWDIIIHPFALLAAAAAYFTNGTMFLNVFMIAIILGLLYAVGEKIFIKPKSEQ